MDYAPRQSARVFDGDVFEEGYVNRNPAEILYIPREAKRPKRKVMTRDEAKRLLEVLDTRERLIAQLAIIARMRPGEILALTWGHSRTPQLK